MDLHLFLSSFPILAEMWMKTTPNEVNIESLTISDTPLVPALFNAYLECLPYLRTLHSITILPSPKDKWYLSDAHLIQLVSVLATQQCPEFDSLHIPNQRIGVKGIDAFVSLFINNHLLKCYDIDMSNNRIGDKGAIALAKLFSHISQSVFIQRLCISGNGIKGRGGTSLLNSLGSEERILLQEIDVSGRSNRHE